MTAKETVSLKLQAFGLPPALAFWLLNIIDGTSANVEGLIASVKSIGFNEQLIYDLIAFVSAGNYSDYAIEAFTKKYKLSGIDKSMLQSIVNVAIAGGSGSGSSTVAYLVSKGNQSALKIGNVVSGDQDYFEASDVMFDGIKIDGKDATVIGGNWIFTRSGDAYAVAYSSGDAKVNGAIPVHGATMMVILSPDDYPELVTENVFKAIVFIAAPSNITL